ncbi:MAG: leucine-rich repeat domain-containing protein, partial [Ruminococcus sp.]|nr:leucine-rich repeat domain-containing protein [Ruminococcus sp.]
MVKKIISAAAAAAIVFGSAAALPQGVFDDLGTGITAKAATEYTSGFWRFTKNSDNTIYISGYTGFDSSITIPPTLEDLKVVGIANNAFEGNQNLEEVIIPANVTYIGYAAFKGSSITKITVPATVKTIAMRWGTYGSSQTFKDCTQLKTVEYNAGDINEELFSGCTALTTVKLGSSTKNISSSAFLNCSSLSSINLNNVTSINYEAFAGCKSLGSVTLGNDLTFLGYRAFAQTGLTSVTIPEKAQIGLRWGEYGSASTFSGCEKLTTATINNKYVGEYEFEKCPALKTVTLGTNIRTIDSNSFSGNKALTTVINKGNPVYIGNNAFSNCTSLNNINLGSSLVYLGYAAFSGDTSLTTMRIPSTVVSLGLRWGDYGSASTFEGCTNLKNVYIANTPMGDDYD